MKQYVLWRISVCCFFLGKKEEKKEEKKKKKKERIHNQKDDEITDGLSEATGIYQNCLSNILTEFLANDGKFLSLIKVLHHFKG